MLLRSSKQHELLNLPNYLRFRNGIFAAETLPDNLKFYFSPIDRNRTVTPANPDFEKLFLQLRSCLSDKPNQSGTCYWVACIRSTDSARKGNLFISVENGQLCFATKRPIEKGKELLVFYVEAFAMARQTVYRFAETVARPISRLPIYGESKSQACCFCRMFAPSSTTTSWPKYCDLCHANLFSELNLRMHIAKEHSSFYRHHSVLPWSCLHCSLNFSLARELFSHLTLHSIGKLECSCVEKSETISNFAESNFQPAEQYELDGKRKEKNTVPCNHLSCQSCSCRGRYKCPVCFKFLAEMQQMASHFRSHGLRRPLACKVCKQPFEHADDAKLHIELKHKTVDGIYNCSTCQKSYATRLRFECHIRYAHPELLLKCTVCKRGFTRSDKLKRHLQTHVATVFHSCTQCKRLFKRKDNLKAHYERMHQNRKKAPTYSPPRDLDKYIYKCLECAKGFKRRGMLICHLKRKHPDKDIKNVPELNMPLLRFSYWFPCEHCTQQFSTAKKRLTHMQKEHPSSCQANLNVRQQPAAAYIYWPVQCPACPQQYARKASLKKHMTKLHPELLLETECSSATQTAPITDEAEIPVPHHESTGGWQNSLHLNGYCTAYPLQESYSQE
ncbi:zinc finger, C2H2 type [Trichuris suis]|nr:zinc finger, C2H2 type [Trichuris suis]